MNLFGKTPRPTWKDEMADELCPTVAQYLQIDNPDEDDFDKIKKVLRNHRRDDGYELGKQFEDEGYDIDANIVADLDCIDSDSQDILRKHIKNWVIEDDIQPAFKEGDIVHLSPVVNKKDRGVISSIRKETAQYGIRFEDDAPTVTRQYIVNYESVSEIK